jgi:hypothetical protein
MMIDNGVTTVDHSITTLTGPQAQIDVLDTIDKLSVESP